MTLREALLQGRNRPRLLGGGSPTTSRGDGYEFAQLRGYVAGDDTRRIDWAATARSGALQTRVMLEDIALVFAAICDRSRSMSLGRRRALADAADDTIAAWFGASSGEDRAIAILSRGPVPNRARPGRQGAALAREALRAQPEETFDPNAMLDIAGATLPRGAALLVVTDAPAAERCDDTRLAEIARRYDGTLCLARDPWQEDLPLHGFARLVDVESGESLLRWFGRRERDAYRRASIAREEALLRRFRRFGWRIGIIEESDGAGALAEAFGIPRGALD
uniref:DUF58 domain-containing protein n=1 Tax=mine drainage metagenome TaxID=410659 RepID=E6Q2L4_9ZZZZ